MISIEDQQILEMAMLCDLIAGCIIDKFVGIEFDTFVVSTVAVGIPVSRHPLHRSVRALLTHTVPTSSIRRRSVLRDMGELCEPLGVDLQGIDRTSASLSASFDCVSIRPDTKPEPVRT
jgi:hypothetical protein